MQTIMGWTIPTMRQRNDSLRKHPNPCHLLLVTLETTHDGWRNIWRWCSTFFCFWLRRRWFYIESTAYCHGRSVAWNSSMSAAKSSLCMPTSFWSETFKENSRYGFVDTISAKLTRTRTYEKCERLYATLLRSNGITFDYFCITTPCSDRPSSLW